MPHSFVSCPLPASFDSKKSIVSTRSVSEQLRRQNTHRPPGSCTCGPNSFSLVGAVSADRRDKVTNLIAIDGLGHE